MTRISEESYKAARRRINSALRRKQKSLDLSNKALTALLQSLVLHGNRLTALPSEIEQLRALQRLDLRDNQLTALPPENLTIWIPFKCEGIAWPSGRPRRGLSR